MTEEELDKRTPTNTEKGWAYYKMGVSGSFLTAICRAWECADTQNRARLLTAFPRLFFTAMVWESCDDPDKYLRAVLEKEDDNEVDM